MRLFRGKRPAPGRLPSLGQDHDAGHRTYVEAIGNHSWLRTKPFSSPPNYELGRCLHSFAHLVDALGLGPGARVLDVGCGPGWLSEFLARCGYSVTGVDVSPDMVTLAQERIDRVNGQRGETPLLTAEFHAMPVREISWSQEFDAAVLYDAMHHFDEETETLRAIRRSLIPGGRIYIHEGVRPPSGSVGERELIEEMRQYGTLESPFDPDYLLEVVTGAGFGNVRRLVEVDRLVPADASRSELRRLWRRVRQPDTNTVIAVNPLADGSLVGVTTLAATLAVVDDSIRTTPETFSLRVRATNTGAHEWPASSMHPPPTGTVTMAPFVGSVRKRREFGRLMLPWSVTSGQSVELDISVPRRELDGADELMVDLVAEGVAWFCDLGTPTLRVPLR